MCKRGRPIQLINSLTLRAKFVLWLLLISVVCATCAITLQLSYDYKKELAALNREIGAIERTTLPALEASVWALDQAQTERLAASILTLPNVRQVRVEGNGVRTVVLGETSPSARATMRTFDLVHKLDNRLQTIGALTVQASLEPIRQSLREKAWWLVAAAAVKILILVVAASLLLEHLVIQHLRTFTQYFRKTPPLTGAKELAIPALTHAHSELAELQYEINQFRRLLIEKDVRTLSELRRYEALAHNNPEIIWCAVFDQPVDTRQEAGNQVQRILRHGRLRELNAAAKQLLMREKRSTDTASLSALPLVDESLMLLLVQSNYRLKDAISQCRDAAGNVHYFRNSLAAWLEQGSLKAIWGIAIDITQSLTTQKALEQREQQLYLSQTRLSEAQALAHMGHWSYYVDMDSLQVSDEFSRIYGFDPDTQSPTWADLIKRIHPEDKSYVIHTLSDPRTQAAGAEHRVLWPSGETRFVQAIARKNIIAGHVDSTFGILIDITDRRRAEDERSKSQRALAESEARLAQAQAIAHMGHWLLDCTSQKLVCSDEFYRLLGHAPQQRQFDQATFIEHIHAEDRALIEHLLVSARERAFTNEFRVVRRDGSQRFMRGTFTPFYAGGRSSARIFGIMMDVTEQKQAELQLRASQELFATAFDSSPDGIFFIDATSDRFIKLNHALAAMFATEEAQLLAQSFRTLPLFVDHKQNHHVYDLMTAKTAATNVEIQLELPGKPAVAGLLSWQRVTIAQKPCILGVIHDVTPLRRLQRTADEQQKQLIQADKLASIGTMVAGVAHEINNPNHLIQMNAELLEGFCLPMLERLDELPEAQLQTVINGLTLAEIRETIPELLTDVRMSSQRINRIVSDLKDFARPQGNSEYLPTSLNQVLKKTLNLLSALLEKRPAEIRTELDDALPLVRADSQRLEQVLVNLIMNALEASDNASPITLRTYHNERENSVVLEVEDTGCGIPEEALQRIFDPFFTTKQDKGGTGLGLAISYRLIQEHGGTLAAHPKPAGGTRMVIKLPPATDVSPTSSQSLS